MANNNGKTPVFRLPEGFKYANNVAPAVPLYQTRLPAALPNVAARPRPRRRVMNAFQPNEPNNEVMRRRRANTLMSLQRKWEESQALAPAGGAGAAAPALAPAPIPSSMSKAERAFAKPT